MLMIYNRAKFERIRPYLPYVRGRIKRRRMGAILVPDVGEVVTLNRMLGRVALADMSLELFQSTNTPTEGDVLGSYTKCDFGGYAAKPLARATWGAATTTTGITSSSYPVQQWVCSGGSNSVKGALYIDADLITLIASDLFATPRQIAITDTLSFTPRWEAA